MNPCPNCQSEREHIEAACKNCGWSPEPIHTPSGAHDLTALSHKPTSSIPGMFYICFVHGICLLLGASMWLFVMILVSAKPAWITLGLGIFQLVVGLCFLFCADAYRRESAMAKRFFVYSLLLFAVELVLLPIGLIVMINSQPGSGQDPPHIVVRDPDSPTVIRLDHSKTMIGGVHLLATIMADGKEATQYAGCPADLVGDAEPVFAIWHNDNPDWVEIRFDNGGSVRLKWNPDLLTRARTSRKKRQFVDPQFELIR